MEWIKLYTGKWLYGSGRTMTAEQRGVWMDILSLAAESKFRDGTLRFDTNQPMGRDYIASVLRLDRGILDACLAIFQKDMNTDNGKARVEIWEDGTIELTNFFRYQAIPEDKQGQLDSRGIELAERLKTRKLAAKFPDEATDVVQAEVERKIKQDESR